MIVESLQPHWLDPYCWTKPVKLAATNNEKCHLHLHRYLIYTTNIYCILYYNFIFFVHQCNSRVQSVYLSHATFGYIEV